MTPKNQTGQKQVRLSEAAVARGDRVRVVPAREACAWGVSRSRREGLRSTPSAADLVIQRPAASEVDGTSVGANDDDLRDFLGRSRGRQEQDGHYHHRQLPPDHSDLDFSSERGRLAGLTLVRHSFASEDANQWNSTDACGLPWTDARVMETTALPSNGAPLLGRPAWLSGGGGI